MPNRHSHAPQQIAVYEPFKEARVTDYEKYIIENKNHESFLSVFQIYTKFNCLFNESATEITGISHNCYCEFQRCPRFGGDV